MNKDNLLTVMVTCYNQVEEIQETLNSLLNQRVKNKFQILVSDDLSTDGSWEVLKRYAKTYDNINVIRVNEKKKVGRNRNNLIKNLKTEYACFVDGDDIQDRDYINHIIEKLNGNCIYHIKGFDEIWENDTQRKYKTDYENVFLYVFKRDLLLELEFDENMKIGEDYLFSLKYFQDLNKNPIEIDTYYKLNRRDNNISLTKNGNIEERLELESKLLDKIIKFEKLNDRINGKINEKKIDIINFSVLLDKKPEKYNVYTKNIRHKHKISYMMYKVLNFFKLVKVYKKIIITVLEHKI